MSHAAFENAFEHRHQQQAIARWADRNGIRRVAIADVSKNLFATYQACHSLGLRITAIVDDRSAFAGMEYRTIPVRPSCDIDAGGVDGFVVSNTNPAQIDAVVDSIGSRFARPMLRLWQPRYVMPRHPAEAVAA